MIPYHLVFCRYSGVACKKVYFLWICPSHRYFEWFIDVLRDVERKDVTNVLEMHIFITQFFHKFDLRTTMLVSYTLSLLGKVLNSCTPTLGKYFEWQPLFENTCDLPFIQAWVYNRIAVTYCSQVKFESHSILGQFAICVLHFIQYSLRARVLMIIHLCFCHFYQNLVISKELEVSWVNSIKAYIHH